VFTRSVGRLDLLQRRPVERLDGEPGFAETFFDDCRVPVANVLGEEGQGWTVAMAAAERLADLAKGFGNGNTIDPMLRYEVADAWIRSQAYRWQTYFTASKLMDGRELDSEASLMKVFWSEMDLELHATALRLLGDRAELAALAPDALNHAAWLDGYVFALSGPIYVGTNEIQRNMIAERVLGPPRRK